MAISRLLALCTEVRYSAGDTIIHTGDESDTFYLIEHGSVNILLGERIMTLLCGECFGESTLANPLSRPKRIATIVAASECRLLALKSHQCVSSLAVPQSPTLLLRFAEIMEEQGLQEQLHQIESDLASIHKYRPFLRDSLSRSSLFNRLKDDQIEALAATIKEVCYPFMMRIRLSETCTGTLVCKGRSYMQTR